MGIISKIIISQRNIYICIYIYMLIYYVYIYKRLTLNILGYEYKKVLIQVEGCPDFQLN